MKLTQILPTRHETVFKVPVTYSDPLTANTELSARRPKHRLL